MATTSMPTSDSVSQSPPLWPELADTHPLSQFNGKLDSILAEAAHDEIYGITLSTVSPFHRNLILQKFLRANSNDVSKASAQLLSALKWRKSYNPTTTVQETFSAKRFGGLGYVTTLTSVPDSPNKKDICTFNIYGAVTDNTLTFGDLDGFMRWRIALMELMIEKLDLKNATVPIPDFGMGADPYQAIQVHDYLNVSFLRQDPSAKAAAQKAIETFQAYYPETLSKKLFVNTPWFMSWMFSAMTVFMSKATASKLKAITYGKDLALDLGPSVPKVYGGQGQELSEMSETLKLE